MRSIGGGMLFEGNKSEATRIESQGKPGITTYIFYIGVDLGFIVLRDYSTAQYDLDV